MHNINRLLTILLLITASLSAQGMMGGGTGFLFPDTLVNVTLSGKVHINSNGAMNIYYLDVNNDGTNDYILSFGPIWYKPNNSSASRPHDGDQITIQGGRMPASMNLNGLAMIVVYQINGMLWRDPFDPIWNDFGSNTHMMGSHNIGCNDYIYGQSGTIPQSITLAGKALVDTTFFMNLYYIDTNNDGTPDYFLNFGPWWHEPTSGAARPKNDDVINISGGKLTSTNGLSVVIVYQINGKVWRDSSLIGRYFGGGWMRKNKSNDKIFNPFDQNDFMMMGNGWNNGMMGGMMSDSLFGRMIELNPYNIPNSSGENIFKGYEMGIFNPNGSNGMMQGGCGGMMGFGANGTFQLHFDNKQIEAYHMDKNSIKVKFWNSLSNKWTVVSNASINTTTNAITFSANPVASYYILTADKVTSVVRGDVIPTRYTLEQNYPNPFNPSTTIRYSIPASVYVTLKVYDVLGKEVATLINREQDAGNYEIEFNAHNLTSGVYFYQIITPEFSLTKKLLLMK